MDDFRYDNLQIIVEAEDGAVRLRWRGSSDARNPAANLEPYLYALLEEPSFKFYEFDFSELEFMNSSTIAAIVHIVERMKGHSAKFKLLFSEQKEWQEFNFRMMKFVTRYIGNITVQRI